MKGKAGKNLTTAVGAQVLKDRGVLTAGPRGIMLLRDGWSLKKPAYLDREAVPGRRMHLMGSGACGTFTFTHDITKHTKAKICNNSHNQRSEPYE